MNVYMVKRLRKIRKSNYVILGILAIIYFGNVMFTTFHNPTKNTNIQNIDRSKFAGSASCAGFIKTFMKAILRLRII